MTRAEVPARVSEVLDGREAAWADPSHAAGDYDGRERTLLVMDTDAREQMPSRRRLEPLRAEMEAAADGPVVIVFFTRRQSAAMRSREAAP